MIERYSRQAMRDLWSEQSRCESWLTVELAVCEALAARNRIPGEDMREIRAKAAFDLERIEEIVYRVMATRNISAITRIAPRCLCFGAV